MAEAEAVELLLERAAIKPTPENETEARNVVALLGYLPLAIDQTAAYIRSRKISLREFVGHYNKRKDRIIAFKPTVSDYYRMRTDALDHSGEPESLSVWTTWEMSFDQIKTSDSGLDTDHLRHFLSTLAFFNKLDIGMDMFQAQYEESPSPPSWMEIFVDSDYPEWDEYSYQDAVSFLEQLSLIQCHQKSDKHTEAGSPYVSLHPLVRDWIQLRLPPKERRDHCVEALRILRHYIRAGQRRSDWPLLTRRALLSHLNAALYFQAQFIKSWDDPRYEDLSGCLQTFVAFYTDHGRYTEAEQTCRKLLDCVTQKSNSKEEIISAEILLSGIHFQQGKYSDVEKNMLRCNALVTPSWPLPIRIGLRKTLGRCYFKQGRYAEATSHFMWALNEQLTEHPSTDPDVLDIKESLAQIYRNQGDHEQATAIYESVLEDCEPENPRIWRVMVNLANNYRAMNLSSQAAELYEQALAGFIPALGPDHPSTIETQLFSAINWCSMGRYHIAEGVLQDVVAKSHKVLGPKHPDTLKAIMNLAMLLDRSGRLKEAEAMYRTALAGREESLGLDNPYTLRTVERLVGLLWALGKVEAAEALALRGLRVEKRGSVEEQMRALDVDEVGVGDKMRDLSLTVSRVDVEKGGVLFGASEVLLRQAIARDEAALERNHPDVLDFLRALMLVRKKQGKVEEVERLVKSLVERGEPGG
ncbi:hypothetical protein B0H66DRAFT_562757 [Apodospora peruviana]|uniref:TPR-like protein n=1 Tax=Apodospora peruviana TaxID=516989 RepID=A0AAE0I273_9PEZI|nr:hypothetical protein B0H66DRAFT_562757 [Apodospora peruviana]